MTFAGGVEHEARDPHGRAPDVDGIDIVSCYVGRPCATERRAVDALDAAEIARTVAPLGGGCSVGDGCEFPICGTENCTPWRLAGVGGGRSASHAVDGSNSVGAGRRCTDGRRGCCRSTTWSETSRRRRGETLRGEPLDDPRVGRDGPVGPGPGRPGGRGTRRVRPCRTSWVDAYAGIIEPRPEEFPELSAKRLHSTKSGRRASRAATAVCGTTCVLHPSSSNLRQITVTPRRSGSSATTGSRWWVILTQPPVYGLDLRWRLHRRPRPCPPPDEPQRRPSEGHDTRWRNGRDGQRRERWGDRARHGRADRDEDAAGRCDQPECLITSGSSVRSHFAGSQWGHSGV